VSNIFSQHVYSSGNILSYGKCPSMFIESVAGVMSGLMLIAMYECGSIYPACQMMLHRKKSSIISLNKSGFSQ
jgi:hypothetical protein